MSSTQDTNGWEVVGNKEKTKKRDGKRHKNKATSQDSGPSNGKAALQDISQAPIQALVDEAQGMSLGEAKADGPLSKIEEGSQAGETRYKKTEQRLLSGRTTKAFPGESKKCKRSNQNNHIKRISTPTAPKWQPGSRKLRSKTLPKTQQSPLHPNHRPHLPPQIRPRTTPTSKPQSAKQSGAPSFAQTISGSTLTQASKQAKPNPSKHPQATT